MRLAILGNTPNIALAARQSHGDNGQTDYNQLSQTAAKLTACAEMGSHNQPEMERGIKINIFRPDEHIARLVEYRCKLYFELHRHLLERQANTLTHHRKAR